MISSICFILTLILGVVGAPFLIINELLYQLIVPIVGIIILTIVIIFKNKDRKLSIYGILAIILSLISHIVGNNHQWFLIKTSEGAMFPTSTENIITFIEIFLLTVPVIIGMILYICFIIRYTKIKKKNK